MGKGIGAARTAAPVAAAPSDAEGPRLERALAAAEAEAAAAEKAISEYHQSWGRIVRRSEEAKTALAAARQTLREHQVREARSQTLYGQMRNGKRSLAALLADLPPELNDYPLGRLVLRSSRSHRLYLVPPLSKWQYPNQVNLTVPAHLGELVTPFKAGQLMQIEYLLAHSSNRSLTSPEKSMVELDEETGLPVPPYLSADDWLYVSSLGSCMTPALAVLPVASVILGATTITEYLTDQTIPLADRATSFEARSMTLSEMFERIANPDTRTTIKFTGSHYVGPNFRHSSVTLDMDLLVRVPTDFAMPQG